MNGGGMNDTRRDRLFDFPVLPAWRTDTVVALCRAMRQEQDWSALPILADALQDAGCDDERLLALLRAGHHRYAIAAGLAGCVMSAETQEAVRWLEQFPKTADCPEYVTLIAAACDHHEENLDPENDPAGYSGYYTSENDGDFLFFGGRDAHGDIPSEFWDNVQLATGKMIPQSERAESFSCSC